MEFRSSAMVLNSVISSSSWYLDVPKSRLFRSVGAIGRHTQLHHSHIECAKRQLRAGALGEGHETSPQKLIAIGSGRGRIIGNVADGIGVRISGASGAYSRRLPSRWHG